MCSKLLLNLIDPIASKEPGEAMKILQRILLSFVSRMEAMAEIRDEWGKFSKPREALGATLEKVKKSEEEKREWEKRRKEKGKGKAVEGEDGEDKMEVEGEVEAKENSEGTKKDEDEKMDTDEKEEKPKEEKEDEEPTLLELDDVDIERAKPVRKAVVMVDPGPDPVKGE